jgi:hypothetical protein
MDEISQFASTTPYMPTRLKLAETKDGWELEKSLRLGALLTRKPGGTAAQPTLEEATAFL